MTKEKKLPGDEPPGESSSSSLTRLEEEISLICLRYFRGDWDLYLDYLAGPRVSSRQRLREVPVVEKLREQDRRTDYLAAILEDEIAATLDNLQFDGLFHLWEQCLILDPEADPFREYEEQRNQSNGTAPEPPPSLH